MDPVTYKQIMRSVLDRASKVQGALFDIPFLFMKHAVPEPELVSHAKWADYLVREFNKPGMKVLEIGSRNVTGANLRDRFAKASYVGIDFYEGENVDKVGDAHHLTEYFGDEERFDLIFSSAVFEHLHMPWVAAQEISKLLKVGGFVFVETHFSYSSHERPWNFFQFSDAGLRALFNSALGFELVDKGMSNPMGGYFTRHADGYLRHRGVRELYCHSEILCKKVFEAESFDWKKVTIDNVVDGTRYPLPGGK
jgi:SAM-dependent methyltransferase